MGQSTSGLKSAVFQQSISVTVNAGQLMQFYNYEEDPCMSAKNLAAPQLTVKALIAGVVAGSFGCLLAIYNGLKTGIVPSLNTISALLGNG